MFTVNNLSIALLICCILGEAGLTTEKQMMAGLTTVVFQALFPYIPYPHIEPNCAWCSGQDPQCTLKNEERVHEKKPHYCTQKNPCLCASSFIFYCSCPQHCEKSPDVKSAAVSSFFGLRIYEMISCVLISRKAACFVECFSQQCTNLVTLICIVLCSDSHTACFSSTTKTAGSGQNA